MKNELKNIDEVVLLKVVENRAEDMEISQFEDWRNASAENAEIYEQFKKAYELSKFDMHSTEANWNQVVNKFSTGYKVPDFIELPEPASTNRVIRLKPLLRVAAVITLVIGLSFLFKYIVFSPEQLIVSGNDLKNNEAFELADGTLVYLHDDSKLRYSNKFGTKNRDVFLEGEAFFEVQRNEELPFQITSNKTTTKVLGTSFNVYSDESGNVKVSVVTGRVEFFTNKRNKVELNAGQQGIYNPATKGISMEVISDPNFQSWKTGILTFRETSLKTVFEVLGQYYKSTFYFIGEESAMPDITTTFDNQPLEAVLEELNLLSNTKTEFKNDTIYFKTMY